MLGKIAVVAVMVVGGIVAITVAIAGVALWLRRQRERNQKGSPWNRPSLDTDPVSPPPSTTGTGKSVARAAPRVLAAARPPARAADEPARSPQRAATSSAGNRPASASMSTVAVAPPRLHIDVGGAATGPGPDVEARLRAVEAELEGCKRQIEQLRAQMDALAHSGVAMARPAIVEPVAASLPLASLSASRDAAPAIGHDRSWQDRLLTIWNELDWELGKPSLSPIATLLRDADHELHEGIVGTYALVVPQPVGAGRSPVYILPFLGKANAHYDDSLFERPQHGDSVRVTAPAKVRFAERGGSPAATLERLLAGHEKLSEVFIVDEPGRIE